MSSRERSASLECDNLEHMKRFSSAELEALSLPPPTADGELLEVDFRMTVFHIGEVNTREQNAKIKIGKPHPPTPRKITLTNVSPNTQA